MWKDTDIKELFKNYSPKPPEKVWERISNSIEDYNSMVYKPSYFNIAQKYTLLAASLASISLMAFMFRYIESPSYSREISKIENLKSESSTELVFNHSSLAIYSNNYIPVEIQKTEYQSIPKLPKELESYKKEIIELAKIDREIAALDQEIYELNQNIHIKEQDKNSNLLALENSNASIQVISLNNKEINKPNHHILENLELSNSVSDAIHEDFRMPDFIQKNNFSHFYITPYLGTNYSKIGYRGTPDNSFYTENANFSGNLGYNIGLQFGYQFSKTWGIESGIAYSQYIQQFQENRGQINRTGLMYINQLDFPLLATYSIPFKTKKLPKILSLKAGLIYNSVVFYQVNYHDYDMQNLLERSYNYDVDKRQYNSMQLGYAAGIDFDAYFTKRLALNLSLTNSLVSQVVNFPTFRGDRGRPIQFSTSFSIGTKFRF